MYLEVYPDLIFLLNFGLDFILIFLLKKVNRKSSNLLRMTLSASVGAVSAVFVGIFPWMNVLLKFCIIYIAASVLMISIAFGKLLWTDLIKQLIVLNLITYFVGGLMNSIYYHTNFRLYLVNLGNGVIFSNISALFVVVTAIAIVFIALLILRLLRIYKDHAPETYEVELILENRSVLSRGLMDSGNCLYDPIYKRPVMVIDNTLMNELLTTEFRKDLEEARNYMESNDYDTSQWNISTEHVLRLRFVPYRSVGKSGMLPGIKLDKVLINTGKETICNENVTAAICDNRLSTKEEYHVILHKDLL